MREVSSLSEGDELLGLFMFVKIGVQYHPSRSGQVPLSFLDGYQGYVQTDGYNGYDAPGRQNGVELVG
jgi:hypothetical protein